MNRLFSFVLVLALSTPLIATAQAPRLPRDPERLVARVQQFWEALNTRQRAKALEFIVPEKRETFLAGAQNAPPAEGKLLGVDLTSDPNRAPVRISLAVILPMLSGRTQWNVTNTWVWQRNNWFLDIDEAGSIFEEKEDDTEDLIQQYTKEIQDNFELLQDAIDLGTIDQAGLIEKQIPIKYTGTLPLSIESNLTSAFLDVAPDQSSRITQSSQHLVLRVNPEEWSGSFTIPIPLRFRYQAASVERVLTVSGNVFVPIGFRRQQENQPVLAGEPFSVFVRNNTAESVTVAFIRVDNKFEVLKQPTVLAPNDEGEIVLSLKPGAPADTFSVELAAPIRGRNLFIYKFQARR